MALPPAATAAAEAEAAVRRGAAGLNGDGWRWLTSGDTVLVGAPAVLALLLMALPEPGLRLLLLSVWCGAEDMSDILSDRN
jgi:hypothetical protein